MYEMERGEYSRLCEVEGHMHTRLSFTVLGSGVFASIHSRNIAPQLLYN